MTQYQLYLAAYGRLQRVYGQQLELLSDIYGKPLVTPDDVRQDMSTVYRAEHDAGEVTLDWLRDELGFVSVIGDDFLVRDNVQIIRRTSDRGLSLVLEDIDGEKYVLAKQLTRGLVVTTLRLVAECRDLTSLYEAGHAPAHPTAKH